MISSKHVVSFLPTSILKLCRIDVIMTDNKENEHAVSRGTVFQLFAAFIASLLAITDGMAIGWTAPMIPYLTSERSHIQMTIKEAEWMETWLLVGIICMLPVTIYTVDKIGRKKTLLLSCILLIICWTVISVAKKVEYMYAARFFKGSGLNMAFVAAPMYIAEIAHKDFRGLVASMVFLMMMIGTLLVYSTIPFVSFYIPSIIAVVLLSTQLVVFFFLPESPHYLLKNNKHEEARKSLQNFRGKSNIDEEFEEIVKTVENDKKEITTLKAIFQGKNYRKSMTITFFLAITQPFSCHEIILMNLHDILNSAGSIYIDSTFAAIIFASLMMMAAVASSVMMDTFGRKFLLVGSTVLTGICLLILAVYFNLKHVGYNLESVSWIPIVSVMVYAVVFKIGLGMVSIVVCIEVLATKIRALGMTLADGFYVVFSILSLQIFFCLKNLFGIHVPFYVFSLWALVTLLFIVNFIPETKGKSIEEIQMILKGKNLVQVEEKS